MWKYKTKKCKDVAQSPRYETLKAQWNIWTYRAYYISIFPYRFRYSNKKPTSIHNLFIFYFFLIGKQ